jgi:tRNA dimethylallyltransferase
VNQPICVVVGPTASGKSELAIALARRAPDGSRPGEVINADSMQLYRGMDIGTAKLAVHERGGVRHHLLDVLEVTAAPSVAEFQAWARDAIADCRQRGVLPIVVGGSSLYVRAVIDRLDFPGTDADLRAKWAAELASRGPADLHATLAARDPEAAASILPSNGRRIVRALEVIDLTGSFTASLPAHADASAYDGVVLIGLDVPRDVLDERIVRRVDAMWNAGFVEEVRGLQPRLEGTATASRAIGYQQVLAFLRGEITEDEARAATITATRKFARRQDRMFHQDPRVQWIPFDSPSLADDALALLGEGAP